MIPLSPAVATLLYGVLIALALVWQRWPRNRRKP